jgi:hypothetical protein
MPRSFQFPDVNDRTANSPVFLVSPEQVIGFYNQENKDLKITRITDWVKNWYIEQAIKRGWNEAKFTGNQCLLIAKVEKKIPTKV